MAGAGSRFVAITREEFEKWLDSFAKKAPYKGWDRVAGKAGVYVVKFSEFVGCRVVTTLTRKDEVKGVGKASTKMQLVTVQDQRLLNKKASPQRYYRTSGWRKTWKEKGVDWWYREIYLGSQDFYDDKASVTDVAAHVAEWATKIEAIADWEGNTFLSKQHANLSKGWTIGRKVRDSIERMNRPSRSAPSRSAPSQPEESADEGASDALAWKERIESISGWESNDFLQAMWAKLRRGYNLTSNMMNAIQRMMDQQQPRQPPPQQEQADPPGSGLSADQKRWVEKLRDLRRISSRAGDDWTANFINDIINKIERYGASASLSDKQKNLIKRKLQQYRVSSTVRLAHLHLLRQIS